MKKPLLICVGAFTCLLGTLAFADETTSEHAATKAKKVETKAEAKAERAADRAEAQADKNAEKADHAVDKKAKKDESTDDAKAKDQDKDNATAKPHSSKGSYEGSYARDKNDGNYGRHESKSVNEDAERTMANVQADIKDEGRAKQERRDRIANPQGVSFAAHVGYGTADAYHTGIGLRVGYTFRNRVYIGGSSFYHFGSKVDVEGVSVDKKLGYLGPEVGYDVAAGPLLIRPVVGFGFGFAGSNVKSADGSIDRNDIAVFQPYLAPGASLIYPIGDFFVGGDARGMFMSDNSGLTLFGTVGYHL